MATFHFPLEPLVAQRERAKDDAARRLGAARRRVAELAADAERCHAAFAGLRRRVGAGIERRSLDLASIDAAQLRIGTALRRVERQLAAAHDIVRLREQDLALATNGWIQLEILRRRAYERFELERTLAAERALDEQNMLKR